MYLGDGEFDTSLSCDFYLGNSSDTSLIFAINLSNSYSMVSYP